MNGLGFDFELDTPIFERWSKSVSRVAKSSVDVARVIELLSLEGVKVMAGQLDAKICQTGYCHTTLPNTIGFAANGLWLKRALNSGSISCVFTNQKAVDQCGIEINKTLIVHERAGEYFHLLHNQAVHNYCYENEPDQTIISPSAKIDESAVLRGPVYIDDDVSIGPLSVITGPVYIGPGTRVEELCTIGSRGLFQKRVDSVLLEFKYYGGVAIGANSHLHARSNVAKAPHFQSYTQVGSNVSIGISSNVGHDCILHDDCTIASTAGVCGRGEVGKKGWVGAGAIVADARKVASNGMVRIGAVVVEDVDEAGDVSGNFAIPHRKNLREFTKRK